MKILLPVDGTALSMHEVRFALRLVEDGLRAEFVLANVQEPASFYEVVTAKAPELIEAAALDVGQDMLDEASVLLNMADVPFVCVVVAGDPAQAMLDLIEEHEVELVVMGTRALGPIRRWLEGGSTSQRLVHNSPVPVLLVTPPIPD